MGRWFALLLVVAIVYVLVRPDSAAGDMIQAVGDLLAACVRAVTGVAR